MAREAPAHPGFIVNPPGGIRMQSSGQQTETDADTFIEQVCRRAAGEQAQRFEQLFADCTTQTLNVTEVVILSGFMPLLAMSLARLNTDIQRGYTLAFARKANDTCGGGAGTRFPQRTVEYLAAFHSDVTTGKAGTLPTLLSVALQHICGASDDSVASCRPAVLQMLVPALRGDVEQFGTIRFAAG
jgi:hypothetical protein